MGPPPPNGFGADYDNQLTILQLRRAGLETRGCEEDLQGFEFRGSGNEPFWNVEISEKGIIFSELGEPQITLPYCKPRASGERLTYSSKVGGNGQREIEIIIDERPCIDNMSGEHFSFSASVILNGRTYAGCARESWSESPPPLTIHDIKGGVYKSEWSAEGIVRLDNGIYREKLAPNSATEVVVRIDDHIAFGDLNGDGIKDGAVILVADPGGSGTFYHLAVVVNANGTPKHIATELLGDRIKIRSCSIDSGEITVEMVEHGPSDPMCCPCSKVTKKYGLRGNKLVKLSAARAGQTDLSIHPGTGGAQQLMNKLWTLRSLGYLGAEEPPVANSSITLEFNSETQFSGFGGCNRYFGGYTVGKNNSIATVVL